jgi:hypothetical protein
MTSELRAQPGEAQPGEAWVLIQARPNGPESP